jgi:hypothetical protein
MNLRNIALTLALVATGTAFAATTTETTVTRDTPNGTVTKHIVRVHPGHRHLVKRTVVYHAPVVHRHYRHVRHVRHPAIVVHQG